MSPTPEIIQAQYGKDLPPLNTPSRGGPFAQVAPDDQAGTGTRGGDSFYRLPFGIRLYRFTGVDMLVEVVDSPFGRMRRPEVVRFNPELVFYLNKLGNPTSSGAMSEDEMITMGQMIGDMLFPTKVRRLFFQTLDLVYKPELDQGIRILLELDDEQLAVIPWEYAYLREFNHKGMINKDSHDVWKKDHTEKENEIKSSLRSLDMPGAEMDAKMEEDLEALVSEKKWLQTWMNRFGFLGLDDHLSIVRFDSYVDEVFGGDAVLDNAIDDEEKINEVDIMFSSSDPFDLGELNVTGEVEGIAAALLEDRGGENISENKLLDETEYKVATKFGSTITFLNKHKLTRKSLEKSLQSGKRIFHFSGHAGYLARSDISEGDQALSVVAQEMLFHEKTSAADRKWERRMARALGRVLGGSSGGTLIGGPGNIRDIKSATDPLRDIKSATDPLRDIKSATDPLRDIKSATDPLRDIKSATDPLRDIKSATDPLRGLGSISQRTSYTLNTGVYDLIDRKEGLIVLEKEETTHYWQDHSCKKLRDTIQDEIKNKQRGALSGLTAACPLFDFLQFLASYMNAKSELESQEEARKHYVLSLLNLYPDPFHAEMENNDSGSERAERIRGITTQSSRRMHATRARFDQHTQFETMVNGVELKTVDSFKDDHENLWNNWILEDEAWTDVRMDHELLNASLRWVRGSHEILWANDLAEMMKGKGISLVVLNSCQTSQSDSRSFEAASVATTLIQAGIPAVIGMQLSIDDESAIAFSRYFYDALSEGVRLELALTQARQAMADLESSQSWGIPTLYMRRLYVADNFKLCDYTE
ncbi:MAG: CHAT domain-containing protein [Rhodothermaceae bacterium]|nr:CHAT domain-containing protein [Rhodothermaceae bacterium]